MMRRSFFFAAVVLGATTVSAQDIEMLERRGVRTLPRAYYERLRAEPDAFELRGGWKKKVANAQANATAVSGTLPLVVIPALFSNSEAPPAFIASAALQSRLFDQTALTSITAFYREASLGLMNISGTVTPWVSTNLTVAEVVGDAFGLGGTSRTRDWLRQAVANVDASIDFAQFDNDGADGIPNSGDDDGRVDGAAFLFHELDAPCGGPGIWPHKSRISAGGSTPAQTSDRRPNGQFMVVDDYIVLGARNCNGLGPLEVNVFAHETGHILGAPDYYDSTVGLLREQRRWVVGCWDLMSAGSWGCGSGPRLSGIIPTHMGALPKVLFRWTTPRSVNAGLRPEQYTLRPAHSSGDVLSVRLSATEYLLVEYRAKQGYDAGLPSSGVLVYHVEPARPFLPPATAPRIYSYQLLEADGNGALVRLETDGGNRGEASDAFGGARNFIDDTTTPSTRLNNGSPTWVRLSAMTVDAVANVARVTVSLAPARLTTEAMVAALGLTPLASEDRTLLDTAGNGNGRFDVGDLRAYLRIRAGSN
ncbi:MAG TPA: M6 family metalloprotease domain-containing protein [Gemmatimonadaceae bacterium]|nr:M6 family metalloprotease domain-containing protein [Gemmatimonadaceae bacterium]